VTTPIYILAFWLAAAFPLRADDVPIVFARSGQKTTVPVGKASEAIALWAFGQRWGDSAMATNGTAQFVAPKVRVPVVFQVSPASDSRAVCSELVVYPSRLARWDKDTHFVAAGTPDWFDTWADAVGLPIKTFKTLESLDAGNWRKLEKPPLLILGRGAAGKDFAAADRLAATHKVNVLVLEADWFGKQESPSHDTIVSPKQLAGALADWHSQSWPLPPTFRRHAMPWNVIANRTTWVAGVKYPLVEEIRSRQKGGESLRLVLSYLPWPDQLGRCEVADELFTRLLTETAKGSNDRRPLDSRFCLICPPAKDIKPSERPVLAAALKAARTQPAEDAEPSLQAIIEQGQSRTYVLDLRGKAPPPENLRDGLSLLETRISEQSPLLILGDNPILDSWKWLKLNRAKHRSAQSGVVWMPDNALPPSMESQLRLMEQFTAYNISLGNPSQETGNEDR
jgi:hypothetical protein